MDSRALREPGPSPERLWHFMCGRGMREKVIGELKGRCMPFRAPRPCVLELFQRAGDLMRPNGATILRLPDNDHIRRRFEAITARPGRAAGTSDASGLGRPICLMEAVMCCCTCARRNRDGENLVLELRIGVSNTSNERIPHYAFSESPFIFRRAIATCLCSAGCFASPKRRTTSL